MIIIFLNKTIRFTPSLLLREVFIGYENDIVSCTSSDNVKVLGLSLFTCVASKAADLIKLFLRGDRRSVKGDQS